ncbi:peptidase [Anopheles sinensis]|uniref:Peptidase n=1 Tax=Anopheles sinensis TaxID=74873 RepID=A0A084W8Z5_ANOSI|nr:peptidase [Anopheles sinensis]
MSFQCSLPAFRPHSTSPGAFSTSIDRGWAQKGCSHAAFQQPSSMQMPGCLVVDLPIRINLPADDGIGTGCDRFCVWHGKFASIILQQNVF